MKRRSIRPAPMWILAGALAGVFASASPAQQVSPELTAESVLPVAPAEQEWVELAGPDTYGTQDGQYEFLSAAEFGPYNIGTGLDVLYETSEGTLYLIGAGTDDLVWASPHLPQGAQIQGFRIFYCDTHASYSLALSLWRFAGYSSFTSETLFSENTIAGTPGCTSQYWSFPHTFDLSSPAGTSYALVVRLPYGGYSLRLRGVRIFWKRQVSPAPATPTFGDVPVGYWAFQHVEALAASGITAGCGGGNFCPEGNLTRAQMAVFLAKALGLHWYAY